MLTQEDKNSFVPAHLGHSCGELLWTTPGPSAFLTTHSERLEWVVRKAVSKSGLEQAELAQVGGDKR